MTDTVVYIEADSIGTVILDTPEHINVTIGGTQTVVVTDNTPDVIVVAPDTPELPAILIGDQPATVVIGDNAVNVTVTTPEVTVIGSNAPGPRGPEGPQGPPGEGAGEADEVTYDNPTYSTVQAALDAILYVAPHINSFTNSRGTVEIGSSVGSVTLTWSFNKAMASVKLNGIDIDPASSSATVTGPFTTAQTWTLTASDETNTATASTSLTFAPKRYWGASALTSLDDANILGLGGSEFASNFNKPVTYDCTNGAYPYLCYPASFGTPHAVTVGGLSFSDFTVTVQDFTNASGFTESYNVIRFGNRQTGAAIPVVWA